MGYSRDQHSLVLSDLKHLHHEWHIVVLFKPFTYVLTEYRWRKWAKTLATLDLSIENILHISAARIADNRTVAQRAGSPLHPPMKPADHEALGNCLGSFQAQFYLVHLVDSCTAELSKLPCSGLDEYPNFTIRVLRTPVGMIHNVAAVHRVAHQGRRSRSLGRGMFVVKLVPNVDCRTDCAARIARGSLHVYAFKWCLPLDLAVGH